uniref:Uncharacterized protein n=1 Tax=Plectus sambesii TaxID=2011161 RepID=A0A914VIY9_9BILA
MLRHTTSLTRALDLATTRSAATAAKAAASPRIKSFEIYRFNPEQPGAKPSLQKYDIDLNQCGPM